MRAADNATKPLRWIVSGGIGSGKSTVLGILRELGATVIEADRIGHEVLAPGGAAFRSVAERWPEVLVDGHIDRGRLAAIVFTDGEQLEALESLTHPAIAAEIARAVATAGEEDVALELPLLSDLAGPGWTRVVVDASAPTRVQRVVARGGDGQDVERRMNAQPDREQWRTSADVVIDNDGSLLELRKEVESLWREHKRSAVP